MGKQVNFLNKISLSPNPRFIIMGEDLPLPESSKENVMAAAKPALSSVDIYVFLKKRVWWLLAAAVIGGLVGAKQYLASIKYKYEFLMVFEGEVGPLAPLYIAANEKPLFKRAIAAAAGFEAFDQLALLRTDHGSDDLRLTIESKEVHDPQVVVANLRQYFEAKVPAINKLLYGELEPPVVAINKRDHTIRFHTAKIFGINASLRRQCAQAFPHEKICEPNPHSDTLPQLYQIKELAYLLADRGVIAEEVMSDTIQQALFHFGIVQGAENNFKKDPWPEINSVTSLSSEAIVLGRGAAWVKVLGFVVTGFAVALVICLINGAYVWQNSRRDETEQLPASAAGVDQVTFIDFLGFTWENRLLIVACVAVLCLCGYFFRDVRYQYDSEFLFNIAEPTRENLRARVLQIAPFVGAPVADKIVLPEHTQIVEKLQRDFGAKSLSMSSNYFEFANLLAIHIRTDKPLEYERAANLIRDHINAKFGAYNKANLAKIKKFATLRSPEKVYLDIYQLLVRLRRAYPEIAKSKQLALIANDYDSFVFSQTERFVGVLSERRDVPKSESAALLEAFDSLALELQVIQKRIVFKTYEPLVAADATWQSLKEENKKIPLPLTKPPGYALLVVLGVVLGLLLATLIKMVKVLKSQKLLPALALEKAN